MNTMQISLQGQWIFYDPELMAGITAEFFDSEFWQNQQQITGCSVGRGTTWFFSHGQAEFVLRHYLRGGMVGKFNRDRYLRTGGKNSRSWREFELLQKLRALQLPVPVPAAGRVVNRGLLYQADLIIERIPQSQDLVHLLQTKPISELTWHEVGRVIALFHSHGVEHADLNSHNILLDGKDKVWLIDFDRGVQHQASQRKAARLRWQQANLKRLKRSFLKELNKNEPFYWEPKNWLQLMAGYKAFAASNGIN